MLKYFPDIEFFIEGDISEKTEMLIIPKLKIAKSILITKNEIKEQKAEDRMINKNEEIENKIMWVKKIAYEFYKHILYGNMPDTVRGMSLLCLSPVDKNMVMVLGKCNVKKQE